MIDSNIFFIIKVLVELWIRKCEKMSNELSEYEIGLLFFLF